MIRVSSSWHRLGRWFEPSFWLLLTVPLARPTPVCAGSPRAASVPSVVPAPAAPSSGVAPPPPSAAAASSTPPTAPAPDAAAPLAAPPAPEPAPAAANAPLAAKTGGATKPDSDVPGPDEDRADAIARDIALHPPQKPVAPHAAFHLDTQSFTLGSLLDRSVRGAENTEIGHVVDVLIGVDGKPSALELDVGGFMGLGNRRIAVAWNLFDLSHPDGTAPLRVALSEAEVRSAPATDAPAKATVVMGAEATSTPPAKPSVPTSKPAPSASSVPGTSSPAPNAAPAAPAAPAMPEPVPPAASAGSRSSGAAAPQPGDNMSGKGPGSGNGHGPGNASGPVTRPES